MDSAEPGITTHREESVLNGLMLSSASLTEMQDFEPQGNNQGAKELGRRVKIRESSRINIFEITKDGSHFDNQSDKYQVEKHEFINSAVLGTG